MHTSVELQPPFSYSLYPLLVVGALILLITVFLLARFLLRRRKPAISGVKSAPSPDINRLKEKYLQELETLSRQISNKEISARAAWQQLSLTIRLFVHETTHIKVQNCTLSDIARLNMPALYELIQEYYAPEFSEYSLGDISSSLARTRKVIEKWN